MKGIVSLQKFGKELGFIHEGLITLRKAGMTHSLWTRLTESEKLSRKVVAYIKRDCELSPNQKRVREIMGRNFLTVGEVVEHFDVFLPKEELTKVPEIPFSEEWLKERRDSHILFLAYGYGYKDDFHLKRDQRLRWYLREKKDMREKLLKRSWSPHLQLGGHTFPLRLFLSPLSRS